MISIKYARKFNLIKKIFSKVAAFSSYGKKSIALAAVFFCVYGAWGAKYRWKNYDGDSNWTNYKNWEWSSAATWSRISDSSADIPGQNVNGHDNTGGSVYLNTDDYNGSILIYITEDITLNTLYIESDSSKFVTLVLSPGVTVNLSKLVLGNESGNDSDPVYFNIKGEGTVIVAEDIRCKNYALSKVTLNEGATLVAKSIINEKKDNNEQVTVTGDGTGCISLTNQASNPDTTITIDTSGVTYYTTGEVPVNTTVYYWNTDSTDATNNWKNSANWKTVDGKAVKNYPGSKDGDTAVFAAPSDKYAVNGFTVADSAYSITIKNTSVANRISLYSVASDYVIPNELHAEGLLLFWGISEVKNLIIELGAAQAVNLKISEKLTIKTSASLWHSGGSLEINGFENSGTFTGVTNPATAVSVVVSGETSNNGALNLIDDIVNFTGGYSGTGSISLASGTLTFAGTTTNTIENLSITGAGTVSFGSATNNTISNLNVTGAASLINYSSEKYVSLGATELGVVDVKFTGNFKSTGTFTASTSGTYFVNGDVDFSGCTSFVHNGAGGGATVFFYNTTSTRHTFTTKSGMAFANLYFGGNVDIDLNGEVTTAYKCQMSAITSDYEQTSTFTSKLTGTGTLKANAGEASIEIDRMASVAGVFGNLEIDADVTCAGFFVQHSGTSVTVNAGKTFSMAAEYRGYGGTDDPKNELIVKGTVTTGTDFGLGAAPTDNGGAVAEVTVANGGNLNVGNNFVYASKLTNKGTVSVTKSITKLNTLVNESGTVTVNDSISGMTSLQNYQNAELTVKNKITATNIFNRGTTNVASLVCNGTLDSCASNTTSLIKFIGDGTLSLNPMSANTVTNIEIDSGKTLTLDSPLTVSGNIKNNGKIVAGTGVPLTVKGKDSSNLAELSGNGIFVVAKENFTGEYLSIGADIKISQTDVADPPDGVFPAKNSVTTGTTTYSAIYLNGWKFQGIVCKWTGAQSSVVSNADNWLNGIFPDISSGTSIVTYADTVTNQPVLDWPVKLGHITITEGNSLSLNGKSFEVTGDTDELADGQTFDTTYAFVNNGIVIATGTGTESVKMLSDTEDSTLAAKIAENGTWHYKGDGSGGVVNKIVNLEYNKLVISGNIGVYQNPSDASDYYTVTARNGITLGTDSDTAMISGSAHFGSPVTLANTAIVGGTNADYTVSFGDTVDGGKSLYVEGGTIEFVKNVELSSIHITENSIFTSTADSIINLNTGIVINSDTTLTCGHNFEISGNIENNGTVSAGTYSLTLKGTAGNLSQITGSGQFVITPTSNFTGEYLKIGSDVSICEVAETVVGGAFDLREADDTCTSVPLAGTSDTNYGTVYKNGWKLKKLTFVWTGKSTSQKAGLAENSWLDPDNWNVGIVPGIRSAGTDGVEVTLPDSLESGSKGWPLLSKTELKSSYGSLNPNQITLKSLKIGTTETDASPGATTIPRLILSSPDRSDDNFDSYLLNVDTSLENYGVIEYTGNCRIYKENDTTKTINDAAHKGWVEYSGGTATPNVAQFVTKFYESTSTADYANLFITGINTENQNAISVDGNLWIWKKSDASSASSLQIKNNLTLKGKFSLAMNCKVEATANTSLIFAGQNQSLIVASNSDTDPVGRSEFFNIEINDGTSVAATGRFIINGSLLNNNAANGFVSSSGKIYFNGTDVQITGNNSFESVEFSNAGSTIKFAAGKTQTITGTTAGSFTVTGTDASKITLTTNASSPSATDTSTWWTLNAPVDSIDVSNALISYSTSANDITSKIEADGKNNAEPDAALFTTTNWFKRIFSWRGETSSSWAEVENWKFKRGDTYYSSTVVPKDEIASGEEGAQIEIDTADSGNNLVLSKNVSVKSLTVKAGKTLDFATYSVTANDSDDDTVDFIVNDNSTLRFAGSGSDSETATASTITGKTSFGNNVTFEYYGGGKVCALNGGGNGAIIPVEQILKIKNKEDGTRTHLQLGARDIQINSVSDSVSGEYFNEGIIEINGDGRISFPTAASNFVMKKGLVLYSFGDDMLPKADFYNLQISGGSWSVPQGLVCENFYLTGGTLSVLTSNVTFTVNKDFVAFGSNYSALDLDWHVSSNTRFAYAGGTDNFINPSSYSGSFGTLAGTVSVGGNFYVNGADMDCTSGFKLSLPAKTLAPDLNTGDTATSSMWGTPYAVAFNMTVKNCEVSCSEASSTTFVSASSSTANFTHQNVTDGTGNTNWQFVSPEVVSAYSVSDNVICVEMNVPVKNLGFTSGASLSNAEHISYSGNANLFTGQFADSACTQPITAVNEDSVMKFYLKGNESWNSDATGTSAGSDDSTDYSGTHKSVKTDFSFIGGIFFTVNGYTLSANYKNSKAFTATEDHAKPVLAGVYTGQELHSANTGTADSQKYYDSHNFIEFRYSEPVDIGDLSADETVAVANVQAQTAFSSASEHGGAIENQGAGLSVTGFAGISGGSVVAGIKSGTSSSYSGTQDSSRPHALYRNFQITASSQEKKHPCRVRISVAGFVDESSPLSFNGKSFFNWVGYIDSAATPSGTVTPLANAFITDLAKDSSGAALKNPLEASLSATITVNNAASADSSCFGADSLYGSWDCLPPVFAVYVTNFDDFEPKLCWNSGDGTERQYEMLGMVDSNTSAYIDKIEMHLFDNVQNYSASDSYKWASRKGWVDSSGTNEITGFSAPESSGGSRAIPASVNMTGGGIRRSSLDGAYSAFRYTYTLDNSESSERDFASEQISQRVKSSLFRSDDKTETVTDDDGLYLGISLNQQDSRLPIRTVFKIIYEPAKSYITDLAGNRLIQTDSGSDKKILHTVDVTPPSFTMTLSPVGEDKIYAVFTKPLAYKGTYLSALGSGLDSVLEKICSNIEFVYSAGDNVDTSSVPSGENEISVKSAKLVSKDNTYSAILFTLNRKISLDDVEKIWLRVNEAGEMTETIFGTVTASFIQDKWGNATPAHTCHAISDFAVNAVNVLYAYADSTGGDGWDEHEIYGKNVAPEASDYAVHEFDSSGGNYNRLLENHDIVFQYEFIGGKNGSESFAPVNAESLALVYDSKANISGEWKSDKYNLLTESDWRIWLDKPLDSLASSFNPEPLSIKSVPTFEKVDGSDILQNMFWKNDVFHLASGNEYQFFFKILDGSGSEILINHDGDKTTAPIPLYAFRMNEERIAAGDFSFLDLWSFTVSSITKQRGGVSILNNVINAGIGEKTAVQVEMQSTGNLNVFVMTLDGNIVKRLAKGTVSAGTHYYYWDGTNGAGKPVARGLYFVRVSGSGIDETRKVMVVK